MPYSLRFLPSDVTLKVEQSDNLLTAAARAGIYIQALCGGEGLCGTCRVHIDQGRVHSGSTAGLSAEEIDQGLRLACTATIESDCVVTIPGQAGEDGRQLGSQPKTTRAISAGAADRIILPWRVRPPIRKLYVELPPPSLLDNIADTERLLRALKQIAPERQPPQYDHPELIRELPHILREAAWQVTLILLECLESGGGERIIAVEPGDTTAQLYGLALDLGTTTLSGLLIDLNSGEVIAEASRYNAQVNYGEDVIARIIYSQKTGGQRLLQEKIVASINAIIEEVCRRVLISPSDISLIIAAGNTVMAHLLLGIDPRYIRQSPYVPAVNDFPLSKAAPLGILAHPSVRLFLYPCVAAFVGGDIVAGVHASRIHRTDKTTLFIDIGTNGEIVIGHQEWLVCAACSAGPAFEGGGIRYGMRAGSGAIEEVHIHPETLQPMIITIGNTNPRGICGSGLISVVAELLAIGVIDRRGKFITDRKHPRIRRSADGWGYILVHSHDTAIGEDIVITEVDLDNLIRTKGAMFAGYQTLLDYVGLRFADLDQVILAGNFGAHINLERAIAIGLLPDIDRNAFHYLGNASLLGCQISLTDRERFGDRGAVSRLMTHLELSDNQSFMHAYMAALFLPHTDLFLFPSAIATEASDRFKLIP
jgi:uncharacterized 2Fe-2S/4Fe-4S cluster protein (DUF4445 family)